MAARSSALWGTTGGIGRSSERHVEGIRWTWAWGTSMPITITNTLSHPTARLMASPTIRTDAHSASKSSAGRSNNSSTFDLGDHQGVSRTPGVDVEEGEGLLVLVDPMGGDLAADDLGEDAGHGVSVRGSGGRVGLVGGQFIEGEWTGRHVERRERPRRSASRTAPGG